MMTGLACVTPGAGVVQSWAAIVIGVLSSSIPWFTMMILHKKSTLLQKAIERRRARLADTEHHRLASPTPEELGVPVPDLSTVDAQLEHGSSLTTPSPAIMAKKFCPKRIQNLPKTRLDNLIGEEAGFITPQKRLLNSIDQVNEKVMLEELYRIKRTPSAKKAEREKKVHTLMSMR